MGDTPDETAGTSDDSDDRIGRLFDALRTRERRRLVATLLDADLPAGEPVPVDALVPAAGDADSFRVALYHRHLPRLAAADYVEWDREAGLLRAGEAYDELAAFVELLRTNEDRLPDDWD